MTMKIMILKKLEIAGFKSFGKKVELKFDSPITAIVGPNGSGKSNVSEAIRWVLGEQSMKSLRGKRGEDLIFHGSGGVAQLGKAKVEITFDNAEQAFPLDFSEVIVSREVYRDGINEYRVNDSLVRLKDIIELMSNVGVGGSGHHIISQGEADRVLYASAKDRKIMIEDALGLRVYHIKQQEAERKLASTAENMREVGMLRREIQPHIRFLAGEAKKIELSKNMREELTEMLHAYLNRESSTLAELHRAFEERESPLRAEMEHKEKEVAVLRSLLSEKQALAESETPKEAREASRKLAELENARRDAEREIGRVEGQLAILRRKQPAAEKERIWSRKEVESEMQTILFTLDIALAFKTVEAIHGKLFELKERVTAFLRFRGTALITHDSEKEEEGKLEGVHEQLLQQLQKNEEERNQLTEIKNKWDDLRRIFQSEMWEGQNRLRGAEEQAHAVKDVLRSLELDRERLLMRAGEFERERQEAEVFFGSFLPETANRWEEEERARFYQKIQRLRIRLEEAGGVNPHIMQEYEEVQQRDVFLAKELDDLEKTEKSLLSLQEQLNEELQNNFSEGVKKINIKFNELFQTMFGGGSAKLALVRLQKRSEEESEGEEKEELGVEISVDIPRKRIKNLDMLSGGERALTSIALLFAMSFVNPPPFLILDETDAALDEANSQRYGAMLRNLSKKTQLIVITHNRQTMKEAGVLYGVTMGTDGVSRLLSIRFEEATEMSGSPHGGEPHPE